MDGVELAGRHAVATAQAAERAAALAGINGILESAGTQAVIVRAALLATVGGVAAHHGHLGLALLDGASQQLGDLRRNGVAARGATQAVEAVLGHAGLGKGTAAGFAAATAIGAGQHLGNLVDQRVFDHLELLGHNVEHYGKNDAQRAEHHHRNQDLLCHIVVFVLGLSTSYRLAKNPITLYHTHLHRHTGSVAPLR